MNFKCDGSKRRASLKSPGNLWTTAAYVCMCVCVMVVDPIQVILEIMPRNSPASEITESERDNRRSREGEKERVCFKLHAFQTFLRRIKIENKAVSNGRTRMRKETVLSLSLCVHCAEHVSSVDLFIVVYLLEPPSISSLSAWWADAPISQRSLTEQIQRKRGTQTSSSI